MSYNNIKTKILILSIVIVQSTLANGNIHKRNLSDVSVDKKRNILLLRYDFKNFNIFNKLNNIEKPDYNEDELGYKSPWLAFFLSMFLPATGQIYNGDYTKALIQIAMLVGGTGLAAGVGCVECGQWSSIQKTLFLTGLVIGASGYSWSIIDAPISSNRHNRRIRRQKGITVIQSENSKYTLNVNRNYFGNIYSLNLKIGL